MTREEAIKELNFNKEDYTFEMSAEVFDMAIKALEQEPCDNCEVGNPCIYCKHEFEPQERSGEE